MLILYLTPLLQHCMELECLWVYSCGDMQLYGLCLQWLLSPHDFPESNFQWPGGGSPFPLVYNHFTALIQVRSHFVLPSWERSCL